MPNIIIFGDSIARWACDYEKQGRVNRLREKVEKADEDSFVYNCGISADTTAGLIKRFQTEMHARKPRHDEKGTIIIFAIGINDSGFWTISEMNQVPLEQFTENIQTLIAQAKEFTDNITFLGLTAIDDSKTQPYQRSPEKSRNSEQVQRYDQQLQTICQQENIPFLSLQKIIEKSDLDDDGLHPNAQGHQKIAQQVRKKISLEINIAKNIQ